MDDPGPWNVYEHMTYPYILYSEYSLLFSYDSVRACVSACVTEYDHSGVLDTVHKICWWTNTLMYRLSADQMGGTTSTVDVSEIHKTSTTTL